MKVTFTCEKCDLVVYTGVNVETADHLAQILGSMDPALPSCPHCTPPAYGPITLDMMAEALSECSKSCNDVMDDYYDCEARFVLRMLTDGGLANDKPTLEGSCTAEDWRDWLLGLARQR